MTTSKLYNCLPLSINLFLTRYIAELQNEIKSDCTKEFEKLEKLAQLLLNSPSETCLSKLCISLYSKQLFLNKLELKF